MRARELTGGHRLETLLRSACFVALGVLSACSDGERFDLGLEAGLRVRGGSFVRGEFPEDQGGPSVLATYIGVSFLRRGLQDKSFTGVLDPDATSALLTLDGDPGYWVVRSGFAFPESPGTVSFDAPLSFANSVEPGPHTLRIAAVDADEHAGPARALTFELLEDPIPEGELVVSLFWDTDSDLDLHLVTPDDVEIYRDRPNSWDRASGDITSGGLLDADSNANCKIDGRRNENIVFANPPPAGSYTVRVEATSLCDAAAARWVVAVRLSGEEIARASGIFTPTATRFAHGAGAGLKVLEFEIEEEP